MLGIEPTGDLLAWATQEAGPLLPVDPATGGRVRASDDDVVAALRAAHQDTSKHTAFLAAAREQRRAIAALLHARGYSYRWIGEQIGVTAQAVEGFVKYRQRRQSRGDGA